MNTLIYFVLGAGYLALLIWGLSLSKKQGLFHLSNVLLLVIAGLVYDNFVIALGKYIGEGNVLENLNYFRFVIHAFFTPTLILFALSICRDLGLEWAKKTLWKGVFLLLTLGLILYELLTSVWGLILAPNFKNGLFTYESVKYASPIMVIMVSVVLLVAGIILLKKFRSPWLLIGTVLMGLSGPLANWIKSFPITNIFEFILILSLLMTKRFQVRTA